MSLVDTDQLNELEQKANAVSGDWYADYIYTPPVGFISGAFRSVGPARNEQPEKRHRLQAEADVEFIEAASPETVLSLIKEIRDLRSNIQTPKPSTNSSMDVDALLEDVKKLNEDKQRLLNAFDYARNTFDAYQSHMRAALEDVDL